MTNIKSTVYPLDYDKNNPMTGFNKWAIYIKKQLNVLIEAKSIKA